MGCVNACTCEAISARVCGDQWATQEYRERGAGVGGILLGSGELLGFSALPEREVNRLRAHPIHAPVRFQVVCRFMSVAIWVWIAPKCACSSARSWVNANTFISVNASEMSSWMRILVYCEIKVCVVENLMSFLNLESPVIFISSQNLPKLGNQIYVVLYKMARS